MNDWIYICRSKMTVDVWDKYPKMLQKIVLGKIAERYCELRGNCKLVEISERVLKKNKRFVYFFARRYSERR